jgi:3-oxoacyl-[acyl-carrier protein] reductase
MANWNQRRMIMSKPLDGKKALVTGSSRGIGRAIAQRLAADGAAVIVNYRENAAAAQAVVDGIVDDGGQAVAVRADISRLSDICSLFDEAEKSFGPLDIVVANAGTAVFNIVAEAEEGDFDKVFDVNAKGTYFTLREAARRINDGGRIVATSTGGTRMWFTQTSLYLGSKGAVEQFVRVLSRELGDRKVTVNAVLPGYTDTDLLPARDRAASADASPLGRIGEPKDIADAVAFLSSDAARWITGQNIGVGGGVM